jgi:hypothetical protein
MYIMETEAISMTSFMSVVSVNGHPIVARQQFDENPPISSRLWLGENVTAAKNIYATIEELLYLPFSMRSVSYKGK